MLYICIPVYNEAPTIGVLLWRIRKMFQDFSREYEIIVFDDGSTDATVETLEPYASILPLTVLGGKEHVGYARAVDALARAASKKTRYARRDAVILMQGDFTDEPEQIPEMVKRFEGGADIVVGEQTLDAARPLSVSRLRRFAPWVLRPFVSTPGVTDPFGSFRLFRISVLRDVIKTVGDAPIVEGEGWGPNIDLLLATAPFARRVETIPIVPRYDLRPRETRIRPFAGVLGLYRFARSARERRGALARATLATAKGDSAKSDVVKPSAAKAAAPRGPNA